MEHLFVSGSIVPEAKSRASTNATLSPRVAASSKRTGAHYSAADHHDVGIARFRSRFRRPRAVQVPALRRATRPPSGAWIGLLTKPAPGQLLGR